LNNINHILIPDYHTSKYGDRIIYVLFGPDYLIRNAKKLYAHKDFITLNGRKLGRLIQIHNYDRGRIKKEVKKKIIIQVELFGKRYIYNRLMMCAWDDTFNIYDMTTNIINKSKHPYSHNIRYLEKEKRGKKQVITDEQRKAIKWLYANKNTTYKLLANAYGISVSSVRDIIKGKYKEEEK